MRYPYLFLDCDGTLFDFDQSERNAIKFLSGQIGFDYEKGMPIYHQVNAQCWAELEQGLMDQEQLRVERFRRFLPVVGCKAEPEKANEIYGDALAKEGIPYPFTKPLLTRLRALGHKLYITTNGIPATQWGRYHASGIIPYVDDIFISGELGYSKPDPRYFEVVLAKLGNPDRSLCAIVGDSLTSDIQGGRNAHIHTIWYNPGHKHSALPDDQLDDLTKLPLHI